MLRRTSEIKGFTFGARDGEIGRAKDFYFDDESWTVRYLVADTGKWLALRQVLISPHAVRGFRDQDKVIELDLTKTQIENSPSIDQDRPVSRQFEVDYYRYYNYPFYWQGAAMWGPLPRPAGSYGQVTGPLQQTWPPSDDRPAGTEASGDPHLRSTQAVTGYYIQAKDGEIGHVEDFVLNDEDWIIDYLVVDTINWWPGKKVLVSPAWVDSIDWHESKVLVNLEREFIKNAPEYDMSKPISREYETRLLEYYGHESYRTNRAAA